MENSSSFSSLRFALISAIFFAAMLCGPKVTTATEGLEASFTPSTPPPPTPQDLNEHSFFSHTALLLSHLGFHELAAAAPSLSDAATTTSSAWSGPSTIFAPSDDSLRTCCSCSVPNLLREHIVPGLFTVEYLRQLAFGTKIETLSPGRCITVTSDSVHPTTGAGAAAKVFVGGVEITQPDLFNNGLFVVHGLQGFVSTLSPFSCDVERLTSLSFPFHPDHRSSQLHTSGATVYPAIMRLMLRDAMLRLPNNGFSILALSKKKPKFDFYVLTVQWPPAACLYSHTPCVYQRTPKIFTVHGLWPSNKIRRDPEFCSAPSFDPFKINRLRPTLEVVWPNLWGDDESFWGIQWEKHGSCSSLRQLAYFTLATDLVKEHNVTAILENNKIVPGHWYEKSRLIKAVRRSGIGVKPVLKCKENDLHEIKLCLDRRARSYIKCPRTKKGNCPEQILIRRKSHYGGVTAGVSTMPQIKPMVEIEDHHVM